MAINLTITPEVENGRVAVRAEGGTIGQPFYLGRRGADGIVNVVRETAEASKLWQRDPSGARTNLFTRPGFETRSSGLVLQQNLFRNPLMLAKDTPIPATIRTNFARNPSFEIEGAADVQSGGGTVALSQRFSGASRGSAYLRATWSKASNPGFGGIFSNTFPVTPGKTYTVSTYVRVSGLKNLRMRMEYSNAAGAWFGAQMGAPVQVRAYSTSNTGWWRLSATVTAPAGAVSGIPCVFIDPNSSSRFLAGEWLDVDAVLSEEGDSVGTYFDGGMGTTYSNSAGAAIAEWTGTPHNSPSRVYSVELHELFGRNAQARDFGGRVGIYPTGTSNDTSVTLGTGDTGALRSGLQPGKTYTVAATLGQTGVQTGTLNANARRIVAFTRVGSGTVVQTKSDQKDNAIGSERLSVTFDVPAGATEAYVRIYSGSAENSPVVTVEQIMLNEGEIALPFFTGDTPDPKDITHSWASPTTVPGGTLGVSTKTAFTPSGGFGSSNVDSVSSTIWKVGGSYSLRQIPTSTGTNAYTVARSEVVSLAAGKTYTVRAEQYMDAPMVGSLHSTARRIRIVGDGMTSITSSQPDNVFGRKTILFTFTVPAGATNVEMQFMHGGPYGSGELFWDNVLVVEGKYTGAYFDGNVSDPALGGWNGTANASTSTRYSESMPITVYDYEAQQGSEVEYVLLDQNRGVILNSSQTVYLPNWGTWIKDPLRPYLNIKVPLNAEGDQTHAANRVLLQPRGSRNIIAQWEKRSAPFGAKKFLTVDADEARRMTELVDESGIVLVDAPLDFGITGRYFSIGKVVVSRAVPERLSSAARYWELEMDEVLPPVGETVGLAATYDSVNLTFSSYLALAASVENYRDLVSGSWS